MGKTVVQVSGFRGQVWGIVSRDAREGGSATESVEAMKNGLSRRGFLQSGAVTAACATTGILPALMGAAAYAESRAAELSGISPRAASVKF